MSLPGKRVAMLAENLFEDLELWYPILRLREARATVTVIGSGSSEVYRGKHGLEVKVDTSVDKVEGTAFDAVIVPGGYCPDYLRRYPSVLKFVKDAHDRGEVIAAICHAPWVLVSAGVLKGRTVTCFWSIKDDVVNSGARYVDKEVVRDGNIITSRFPDDLPAFCREIIGALGEVKVAPLKERAS